jgi:hypothetical protein
MTTTGVASMKRASARKMSLLKKKAMTNNG